MTDCICLMNFVFIGDMHDFFVGLMGKRTSEPGRCVPGSQKISSVRSVEQFLIDCIAMESAG